MSTATALKPKYDPESPPSVRTDADRMTVGDLVLVKQYAVVRKVGGATWGPVVELEDIDTGLVWERRGREIIERMGSADQYDAGGEVELTKTQLVQRLSAVGPDPFTVTWIKKDGTERTLRGRLISRAEHELGYSWVEDLDISRDDKGGRLRQVDHRTIQALTVNGVKYTLKK